MKNILVFLSLAFLTACTEDHDDTNFESNITLNFSHTWDGEPVSHTTFNTIQYTNANGEQMSIEKLRYLISGISFQKPNGDKTIIDAYYLVDVTNAENLVIAPSTTIPPGTYSNVSFIFGFNNEDNYGQTYSDLNATSWNVPALLGGGYHFMQLEGKFIDNTATTTGYAYHTIRAVNTNATPLEFQDTFFVVNLGEMTIDNNTTFNVEMNIAEWFKNPNRWDLNVLNNMLMPNYQAQIMMYENGQHVFNLKSVTP